LHIQHEADLFSMINNNHSAQAMSEEYLDIVDENNNPTGESRPRSEVHSQGIWHRTVHIYLFREHEDELELLVHLRSEKKDLNPGRWDTRFGGHLKAGQSIEKAVASELKDEIGLVVQAPDLIAGDVYKRDKGTNKEFTQTYYYRFNDNLNSLRFNDGEIQKVKWMTADDIERSLTDDPENWSSSPATFREIVEFLKTKISFQ
jgi:isopentenyldiphosphate isomerase